MLHTLSLHLKLLNRSSDNLETLCEASTRSNGSLCNVECPTCW